MAGARGGKMLAATGQNNCRAHRAHAVIEQVNADEGQRAGASALRSFHRQCCLAGAGRDR